jgi:Leucine-rich repeat (LRR) protein
MPAEMIHILANMPFLVDVFLYKFRSLDKLPESQVLPQGLRQLSLICDAIEQDPMPILEKLPCLVVLMLPGYQGHTMFCSAQGFPRLQELDLSFLYIEEWRMEGEAMPRLSCLMLSSFPNLKKLPEGLLHLPSLNELHLHAMDLNSDDDITWKKLDGKGCKVGD